MRSSPVITRVMTGVPEEVAWDGTRERRWPGSDVSRVHEVMEDEGFDGDAARRLGLYAYNVARKFFPNRGDLVEEAVQETLTRTCERWERANQRGTPEGWAAEQVGHQPVESFGFVADHEEGLPAGLSVVLTLEDLRSGGADARSIGCP